MRCSDGRRQIGAEPDVKRKRPNSQSSGSAGGYLLGDARENRTAPIVDFVDTGQPVLLQRWKSRAAPVEKAWDAG